MNVDAMNKDTLIPKVAKVVPISEESILRKAKRLENEAHNALIQLEKAQNEEVLAFARTQKEENHAEMAYRANQVKPFDKAHKARIANAKTTKEKKQKASDTQYQEDVAKARRSQVKRQGEIDVIFQVACENSRAGLKKHTDRLAKEYKEALISMELENVKAFDVLGKSHEEERKTAKTAWEDAIAHTDKVKAELKAKKD